VLLFITQSYDPTADVIAAELNRRSHPFFRLNRDLIQEYRVTLSATAMQIAAPNGRAVELEDVHSVFWGKPFQLYDLLSLDSIGDMYRESLVQRLLHEIYSVLVQRRVWSLIDPGATNRVGKVAQMRSAIKYFSVPEWHVFSKEVPATVDSGDWVSKVLSTFPLSSTVAPATVRVDPALLDPTYVWFIQREEKADVDVTVVFVAGRMFAYEFDQSCLMQPDWRVSEESTQSERWKTTLLPKQVEEGIRSLMNDLCLAYGRIDFLRTGDRFNFLEINTSGQWAWLDENGKDGLISAVVDGVTGKV
jgi:hypothetical protein